MSSMEAKYDEIEKNNKQNIETIEKNTGRVFIENWDLESTLYH
jgi:hypothetical protein